MKYACSEEVPEPVDMGGSGFSVAFDPLDGSSIVDTNFAVGTILGIWPGDKLTGITGREQVRWCYSRVVPAQPGCQGHYAWLCGVFPTSSSCACACESLVSGHRIRQAPGLGACSEIAFIGACLCLRWPPPWACMAPAPCSWWP